MTRGNPVLYNNTFINYFNRKKRKNASSTITYLVKKNAYSLQVHQRKGKKMKFQDAVEKIKQYLPDYASHHLEKSKGKNQYVCTFCGSGNGTNATGAFTVYPTNYYCFACHQHGDIFDLAEKTENIPKSSVIQYLADKYHVEIDPFTEKEKKGFQSEHASSFSADSVATPEPQAVNGHEDNYTSFFLGANRHLGETDYHRGISLETLNYFNIGYVKNWQHPKNLHSPFTPRLIIPTSETSYLARDTRNNDEIPENQRRYAKLKVGKVHLFNEKVLAYSDVVYVVEGEIDALSIMDVSAYDRAVGLGSVSNIHYFFTVLDKTENKPKFILSLDNDSVGEKARNALAEGFQARGIAYCVYNPCGGYKDQNEALMNTPEAFRKAVMHGIEHIDRLTDEQLHHDKASERKDYDKQFSAKVILRDFVDGISRNVNSEVVPTGFRALDAMLDGGLYEGLYGIGAISSLGKTTFVLQMADQIAEQGHEVLIFSLEMSKNELIAKSISRNTIQRVLQTQGNVQNAKTTRGILSYTRYSTYCAEERELIRNSIRDYEKIAENVFIREGMGDVTAQTIVEQVREHIESGHRPPVVIVDYLQILSPKNGKWTDKQNTDNAILTFKRLSRDFKIPVIVISSFNRENYSVKVSMQAFKESGAIEYSTDVLIGLQLKGVGSKNFDVDKAKSRNPREVEAVVLKNRNGRTGGKTGFQFYAMFNYFAETDNIPTDKNIFDFSGGTDLVLNDKNSKRL